MCKLSSLLISDMLNYPSVFFLCLDKHDIRRCSSISFAYTNPSKSNRTVWITRLHYINNECYSTKTSNWNFLLKISYWNISFLVAKIITEYVISELIYVLTYHEFQQNYLYIVNCIYTYKLYKQLLNSQYAF